MGLKTFQERDGLKLVSDERDVMVPARHRIAVMDWCDDNDITAEMALGPNQFPAFAASVFGVNLWRVRDERQRVMFVLRWA